jgi:hypothetical protein
VLEIPPSEKKKRPPKWSLERSDNYQELIVTANEVPKTIL